jgi:hypothetical protein
VQGGRYLFHALLVSLSSPLSNITSCPGRQRKSSTPPLPNVTERKEKRKKEKAKALSIKSDKMTREIAEKRLYLDTRLRFSCSTLTFSQRPSSVVCLQPINGMPCPRYTIQASRRPCPALPCRGLAVGGKTGQLEPQSDKTRNPMHSERCGDATFVVFLPCCCSFGCGGGQALASREWPGWPCMASCMGP